MAYLFLDMETSGLIRRDLPLGEDQQPWAVKVAVDHTDGNGVSFNRIDVLVRAEGRKVKSGAEAVHGIDAATSERQGMAENLILAAVADLAGKARAVVSYGDFDRMVVESLMIRLERKLGKPPGTYRARWIRPGLEFVNVMAPSAQQVCKIPSTSEWGAGEYKWPSLDEAAKAVLGETPDRPIHDAWADLTLVKRIFFALRERGHFDEVKP